MHNAFLIFCPPLQLLCTYLILFDRDRHSPIRHASRIICRPRFTLTCYSPGRLKLKIEVLLSWFEHITSTILHCVCVAIQRKKSSFCGYNTSPRYGDMKIIAEHRVTRKHTQNIRPNPRYLVLELFRDARNVTSHIPFLDLVRVDLRRNNLPHRSAQRCRATTYEK